MIEGRKIKLAPMKEKDLDRIFPLLEPVHFASEFFLQGMCSEVQFRKNFSQTGLWEENEGCILIHDKENSIVGAIWYRKDSFFDAMELYYWIFDPKDRGKGYMSEALPLFSAYLFGGRKINRLQIAIPDYHRASIAVAQKSGFVFEGIARGALFSKGKYIDLCIYAQLRSECKTIEKLYSRVLGF